MPSLFVVAGEVSGDTHGGNLVRALRELRPELSVRAVGGGCLRSAGAEVLFPMEELSAMGLWEAAGRLPALLRARRTVLSAFDRRPPDLFVPVDFGGLNLRLARAAKARGIPVAYYVPPKIWAWGAWRAKRLREVTDRALVILPFEEEYLRRAGIGADYVGSPVLDHLGQRTFQPEPETVGLLPGSRPGEVSRIWPLLLQAARLLGSGRRLRFLASRAPGLADRAIEPPPSGELDLHILPGGAQEVMERSRVCLVASGTATLECAVVGTPMVVVYRVHPLTYGLGRLLVSAPFISLPNLIAGRLVVREFVQPNPQDVAREANRLLPDGEPRSRMVEALAEVRSRLGPPGASRRAAEALLTYFPQIGMNTDA
jgi:lipid-A-disaccharide synthase